MLTIIKPSASESTNRNYSVIVGAVPEPAAFSTRRDAVCGLAGRLSVIGNRCWDAATQTNCCHVIPTVANNGSSLELGAMEMFQVA